MYKKAAATASIATINAERKQQQHFRRDLRGLSVSAVWFKSTDERVAGNSSKHWTFNNEKIRQRLGGLVVCELLKLFYLKVS